MTQTLKLTDVYGSINLSLNDTSGMTVLFDGGAPQRAVDPNTKVIETFKCKVIGTGDNNLAVQLIALDRILENAARYDQDSTEENEVWLVHQLSEETNDRQALVLGGSWQFDVNPASVPTANEHTAFITLAIKRMAAWEYKPQSYSGPTPSGLQVVTTSKSVFGGAVDLSSVAKGNMPARTRVTFAGRTGTIETVWSGLRSIRKHAIQGTDTVDHFVPIWEAELGTMGTNTATTASYDASSTGSTPKAILVSFANANWDERVVVTATQVASTYEDRQTGRFLVLGRMRLDSGTDTVQVRLRSGWYSAVTTPQYKTLDPVTVSGTSFQYYELGTVKFPPGQGLMARFAQLAMKNAALSLLAARTSGTTSKLVVDHFAMLPIDEGFVKMSGLSLSSSTTQAVSQNSPKNEPVSISLDTASAGPSNKATSSIQNFFMPFNPGSLYVFGQRSGVSTIGDVVDVTVEVWPRYYDLRGTE